ncbi:MAG: hypothetical protein ACRDBO_05110 [Lachnospiraceae bacterium]
MIDNKRFEQEYKSMQNQNVPDLWNRIEAGLDSNPDRSIPEQEKKPAPFRRSPVYVFATAAASFAVLVTVIMLSRQAESIAPEPVRTDNVMAESAGAGSADYEVAAEAPVMAEAADTADEADTVEAEASAVMTVNALHIPEDARTVAADASYFSEAVLQETDLLCSVVVDSVAFGYHESGNADHVVYEVTIGEIHYASGYVSDKEPITVSSPIVQADADEAYLLYQMKQGNTYLLPLKESADGWELIYPFAPQIQMIDDRKYVFHSGYTSLINQQTFVTKGEKEGANDFYYDRMLVREDETFLSDLISLVD